MVKELSDSDSIANLTYLERGDDKKLNSGIFGLSMTTTVAIHECRLVAYQPSTIEMSLTTGVLS